MSIGGGEILRAVLSDPSNVVDYQPAFYCLTLNSDNGTGAANATERGFLQMRKDKYFLMTGIVPTATQVGGSGTGFLRISLPEKVRIFDPSNSDEYFFKPPIITSLLAESSLNWMMTLPEYILWEPASIMGVEWTGLNFNGTLDFKFLSMVGIEFGMK